MLGNYEPEMRALEEQIRTRSALALRRRKMRALQALDKHARCKLASYFHSWTNFEFRAKYRIVKNVWQIYTRLYENGLRQSFNLWNNGVV